MKETHKQPGIIRLNQVGYLPEARKVALFTQYREEFQVCASNGDVVVRGKLRSAEPAGVDPDSGDTLWEADFSEVSQEGLYTIRSGDDASPAFSIGNRVYDELTAGVLKMFYYQRCGGEGVSRSFAGDLFAHGPCHTGQAAYYDPDDPLYGGIDADVSGGWHDAGDYGRYVTPASKAVADLLFAAEHFPSIRDFDFGGPSRILDEIRYEIEWMLKMQNPETGGVYHKVTTQYHAGLTWLPDQDDCKLFLSPVSAQATGCFAAVMALSSRVYRESDGMLAERCLRAAEKAWNWLTLNPDAHAYIDPEFFKTGKYGDSSSHDERFWAAVELYNATGGREYLEYISGSLLPGYGLGWADMGTYALASFLEHNRNSSENALYEKMKKRFLRDADRLLEVRRGSGYGVAADRYVWGSNMDVANAAMQFIMAFRISGNQEYELAAMDQFHYLMGRNAVGMSYVTGFGENAAKHPHHRPSMVRNCAVPGMLVGGPFAGIHKLTRDPAFALFSENTPPAKCYIDCYESFSSNEICIYWNSPLAYILAYLGGK
jgi:endoglucanase